MRLTATDSLGEYSYDAAGNKLSLSSTVNGVMTDTSYTYDVLNRLISETITDPINGNYSASYDYDKVGNRTYATIDGVQTAYTYDDNDRLTQQGGTSYTYDVNGNTQSESIDTDQTTYQWDSNNRLIESIASTAFGSTTSTFAYDIDDNRVSKTVDDNGNTSSIAYIVDNNQDYAQVLHEVDSTTLNTNVTYTYGDDLLAQSRAGQLQIYHYDGLGSTRLLTDANGNTTDAYHYEAFGDLLSQSGFSENNYLFTGEQYDDELGQYYLRARYYDQGVGRFTNQDTWMGNGSNPLTLNKYTYGNIDPVNTVDPSGRFGLASFGAVNNIRSTLTSIQIDIGTSLLDAMFDPDNAGKDAGSSLLAGVASLGGQGAFKVLRMLSSKFRKACNSFDGDTLVATEYGQIPISDIRIGNKVWAYNEETGERSLQEVVHLIQGEGQKDLITITLESGEEITATAGHPFYQPQEKQWLDASELNPNDVLLSLMDTTTLISDIETHSQMAKVYNLTVANDHSYYVGDVGVLSHNAGNCIELKSLRTDHILRGNVNGRNAASGWHSRPGGYTPSGRRIVGHSSAPDSNGVYEAIIEIKDKNGKWQKKHATHTFFPDRWGWNKVLIEIRGAYVKGIIEGSAGKSNKWRGISPSGVEIRGYIDSSGKITQAYPVRGN